MPNHALREGRRALVRNAAAKAEKPIINHIGKAEWQTPQIKTIPITDEFDPSSGTTRREWLAARELKARAAQQRAK
jgi:hypothetical protein